MKSKLVVAWAAMALMAAADVSTNSNATAEAKEPKPLTIWEYPALNAQQQQLKQQMIMALQRGDKNGFLSTCREGVKLLPGEPTWQYNLACALCYFDDVNAALDALDKAVDYGFRDAQAMENDRDLMRLRTERRFADIVKKARELVNKPTPNANIFTPAVGIYGGEVQIATANVVWDFDEGLFATQLRLLKDRKKPFVTPAAFAKDYKGPAAELVSAWLRDGTAASNMDDIYINRDRRHSNLQQQDFPLLTRLTYCGDATKRGLDCDLPNTIVVGRAVFGNLSRALTNGPYWRSMARMAMTRRDNGDTMEKLYRSNQFHVFPAVNDYGKPGLGDIFPAYNLWQLMSQGASGSDQAFLRVALAASAAMQSETKKKIIADCLFAPTMQWLIRSTLKTVKSESDYLSENGHPVAFNRNDLDENKLVTKAHVLTPDKIPPLPLISWQVNNLVPEYMPLPGRDYPDTVGEVLYVRPTGIAFILRGYQNTRSFLFKVSPMPESAAATYKWSVIHGESERVTFSPTLEKDVMRITVNRKGLTNRIDVAVFAKTAKSEYGAPSIISFSPVALEDRVYLPDGRLKYIDYSNPSERYCDPLLALPRRWRDEFIYDDTGALQGWKRRVAGEAPVRFTHDGKRLDANGKAIPVKYIQRAVPNNPISPVELTYVDDEK